MTPSSPPAPPSSRDSLINLYGLILALVVIVFGLRIYASLPRPDKRPAAHAVADGRSAAHPAADGRAAEQPVGDERLVPFTAANDRFRAFYSHKRTELLAKQPLVIAISGDNMTFTTPGATQQARFTPAEYHVLKTHAHLALALNLALAGGATNATPSDLKALNEYVGAIEALRPRLALFRLDETQRARQNEFVDSAKACLAEMAKSSDMDAVLKKHTPKLRDLALQNAYDASKVQIDGLRQALADFAKANPSIDLKKSHVVVSGVQPARAGNLQMQTIARTLGFRPESESLVYAESRFEHAAALDQLGTRILDSDASRRIFDDSERLWRDLLADAASAILAKEEKR